MDFTVFFPLKSCIPRTRRRECQSECKPNCGVLCYAWCALHPSFPYALSRSCSSMHWQHYASLPPPKSPSSSELPSGSDSSSLQGTYVFIHGWVYDVENGEVTDLNVSLGPPGREIPKSPWPATEERERRKRSERKGNAWILSELMLHCVQTWTLIWYSTCHKCRISQGDVRDKERIVEFSYRPLDNTRWIRCEYGVKWMTYIQVLQTIVRGLYVRVAPIWSRQGK